MQALQIIDQNVLDSVTGGVRPHAAPQTPAARGVGVSGDNSTTVNTNIGVTYGALRVGVQNDVNVRRTDYAQCLGLADRQHATPAQTVAMCGRPGGR